MLLHLFKKTYLDIDIFINKDIDRIVISETNGYMVMDMMEKLYVGRLFAQGMGFDDVVGAEKHFPSFEAMLNFCSEFNDATGKKVVIYCDQATFMKISAMWFKTIFANIDSTSAYRLVKGTFAKKILIASPNRGLEDDYRGQLPTQVDYHAAFEQATVDINAMAPLMAKLASSQSVEYLLASYINSGSHKDQLKLVMRSMINRHVQDGLREVWRSIQINIIQSKVQERLGVSGYTIDNVLDLINDVRFNSFKLTNATKEPGNSVSVTPNMDLSKLTSAQIDEVKAQVGLMTDAYANSVNERFNLYIDMLINPTLSDADLTAIIDFDVTAPDDVRFWGTRDRENINLFFVDFIFEAKKHNRLSTLAPYQLRA